VVGFYGPLPNPVTGDTGPADSGYSITLFSTQRQMNIVFQTYAYCFDNPPLRTLASAAAVSSFQQPEDSPEITALEKTTKLKQQWLELLP